MEPQRAPCTDERPPKGSASLPALGAAGDSLTYQAGREAALRQIIPDVCVRYRLKLHTHPWPQAGTGVVRGKVIAFGQMSLQLYGGRMTPKSLTALSSINALGIPLAPENLISFTHCLDTKLSEEKLA